jgi:hypothetical protein
VSEGCARDEKKTSNHTHLWYRIKTPEPEPVVRGTRRNDEAVSGGPATTAVVVLLLLLQVTWDIGI